MQHECLGGFNYPQQSTDEKYLNLMQNKAQGVSLRKGTHPIPILASRFTHFGIRFPVNL